MPYRFAYHRPTTIEDAVGLYEEATRRGDEPLFYGGGTEILSRARLGDIAPGAVIDLKGIPETRELSAKDGTLTLGSALTLDDLRQAPWPLLAQAAGRVADHTTRRQITLGGNLASVLIYREVALPFLLAPATAVVAGPDGVREVRFEDVFGEGVLDLPPGSFLVALRLPLEETIDPGIVLKRTRLDWVDYPLVTVAVTAHFGQVGVALSGYTRRPFRAGSLEEALNRGAGPVAERIGRGIEDTADPISDLHGSSDYRRFVLGRALEDALDLLRDLGNALDTLRGR